MDNLHNYEKLVTDCYECTRKHLASAIAHVTGALVKVQSNYHPTLVVNDIESDDPPIHVLVNKALVKMYRASILLQEARRYEGLDFLAEGLLSQAEYILEDAYSSYPISEMPWVKHIYFPTVLPTIREARVQCIPVKDFVEARARISKVLFDMVKLNDYVEYYAGVEDVLLTAAHIEEALREFPVVLDNGNELYCLLSGLSLRVLGSALDFQVGAKPLDHVRMDLRGYLQTLAEIIEGLGSSRESIFSLTPLKEDEGGASETPTVCKKKSGKKPAKK